MDNTIWNMLLNQLPSMKELDTRRNHFSCNFSEIALNTNTNLKYLFISYVTNFYGTISIDNFLSKFPKLSALSIRGNNLMAHFDNFDFVTTMPTVIQIEMDNNLFTGSIKLSSSLSLPNKIEIIRVDNNDFSYIDWNIFANLHSLKILDVGPLINLNGVSINWNIIGSLSYYNLIEFDAKGVQCGNYADFSHLSETIKVSLIVNYLCDPTIYLCPNGEIPISRSSVSCIGRTNCVATCRCSNDSIPMTLSPTHIPSTITISPTQFPFTVSPTTITTHYETVESNIEETELHKKVSENIENNDIVFILIGITCIIIVSIACIIVIYVYKKRRKSNVIDISKPKVILYCVLIWNQSL
eukprot:149502_1